MKRESQEESMDQRRSEGNPRAPPCRQGGHALHAGDPNGIELTSHDRDFEKHVDYIHYNPVKHGYTQRPIDWRWSSIHRYVGAGILPPDWAGDDNVVNEPGADYGEPD